ncbi:MAG: metallopeptidase TldD-related protein [Pseudomonadota bacterium]
MSGVEAASAERRDLEDVAAALLEAAKAAGAEASDVIVAASEALQVTARAGALEAVERSETLEFGLRVLMAGEGGWREASVSASDPKPATLSALAERAVAMAREAPADPYGAPPPKEARIADPSAMARRLSLEAPGETPDADALLESALGLEAAALAVAGVAQAEGASASAGRSHRVLAASDGFLGAYGQTSFSRSISAVAGEGVGMERDYAYSVARSPSGLRSVASIGGEAGERAVKRLAPRRAPAGPAPVMFDRRVATSVVSGLLSALNGEQVARGSSFLAKRMGERIMPDGVDLIDDPSLTGGLGSRPFDGEGVAGARKRLIADGVVSEWLLDHGAARRLGLASNGSAARGVSGGARPAASNAWLTVGEATPQRLMAEMGRGLLVTEMMGRGLNPVTGDYSRGASGFWIEEGEIAYPVSELTIAGSFLEMLSGMRAADELRFDGRIASPSLLMEGLTLGSG